MLASVAAVAAITSVMVTMAGVSSAPADAAPRAPIVAVGQAPAQAAPRVTAVTPLLQNLASESSSRIEQLVSAHPASIAKLLVSPPAAKVTESWWDSTSPARQRTLIDQAPTLIGNLDGIPFPARAKANAIGLKREIQETKKELGGIVGKGVRSALQEKLQTLGNVEAALQRTPGGPARSLWILDDTSGDLRAAIVVGNLDTAHFISYMVPGMYMSVSEQLQAWTVTAQEQYEAQRSWLARTTKTGEKAQGVATVAWIGYDTPELLNIAGLKLADEGANYLQHSIAGLQADRASDPPYITVMAHSYGSTAALMALQSGAVSVNALALLGSPGSTAQSVANLDVKNGNVYVGQATMDPVVHSAFFGSDPGSASYGAHLMGVSGGIDPIDHRKLTGSVGHNEYFTPGTESMRNLALIAIDQGQLVIAPKTSAPAETNAEK